MDIVAAMVGRVEHIKFGMECGNDVLVNQSELSALWRPWDYRLCGMEKQLDNFLGTWAMSVHSTFTGSNQQ